MSDDRHDPKCAVRKFRSDGTCSWCDRTQWSDDRYVEQQKAYGDGEYDGYWGVPRRTGTYPNLVWTMYLRGYLAGVKERQQEPSDEQINAWMRTIGANDDFDDTPVVEHGYHDEYHAECPLCNRSARR